MGGVVRELEPAVDAAELGGADRDDAGYPSDSVGTTTRLLDVMRNALSANESKAGSKEISEEMTRAEQRLEQLSEETMSAAESQELLFRRD